MQSFKTLRQSLLGELAMSPERRKREREKNAICSGHLRLCQQPRAAHALRSDQQVLVCKVLFRYDYINSFILDYIAYSIHVSEVGGFYWYIIALQVYLS